jgi:hypothetical protein
MQNELGRHADKDTVVVFQFLKAHQTVPELCLLPAAGWAAAGLWSRIKAKAT